MSHMWRTIAVFCLLGMAGPCEAGTEGSGEDIPEGGRDVRRLTTGWGFQVDVRDLGEQERWFDPKFDRSAWSKVDVPKAWDLYDEALRGYEGVGWYCVRLDGSWRQRDRVQLLKFGRVNFHTKVWLNGELLGEHVDGYLPCVFDVSKKLRDEANELVLRVDNRPRLEWLPAGKQIEWVQYGGILQPVELAAKGPISIADLTIKGTPQGPGAAVACVVVVDAQIPAEEVVVRVRVDGAEADAQSLKLPPLKGGSTSTQELAFSLDNASAWSPDSPNLHRLAVTLERGGQTIDRVEESFGVRAIEVKGRQLLLNGKPLKIQGVNRYDELGRYGPNAPENLVRSDVQRMKQAGVNLVRTHYPQSPEILALYDEFGILLMEELPINWWGQPWGDAEEKSLQNEAILDQALPMLERMIQRDKNHPCLIIWSMGNESKTDNAIGIRVMRRLIQRTKQLDKTRLVTFVIEPDPAEDHRAFEDADLVAFNMYPGTLIPPLANHRDELDAKTYKAAVAFIAHQLSTFPEKPMIVGEFGAPGIPGIHGDAPSTEEFQAAAMHAIWRAITGANDLSGGIVWSWADYYHRRNFIQYTTFGPYGVVTVDRRPKAALSTLAEMFGGRITLQDFKK